MNINVILKSLLVAFLMFNPFMLVFSKLSVGPLRLEYGPGKTSAQNIVAKNIGKSVIFVQVDVAQMHNMNSDNKNEETLKDPKKAGVLIIPDKLIIKPGQQKNIRVMWGKKVLPKEDKIFMLEIYEVKSKKEEDLTKNNFHIRYGVLMVVHAKIGKPDIVATRKGKDLTLENKGAASAKISMILQCNDEAKKECKDPAIALQLLAGEKKTYTLPFAKPIEFVVRYMDSSRKESSN